MTPEISVVIPAYNEARYLPRLLDGIDEARRRYRRGREAVEVIVADNNSTDDTARIAAERGCRLVSEPERRIASVRNAGGRAARGKLLAFIDADTQVHPETFNAMDGAFARGDLVIAVSGAAPERRSLGIDACWVVLGFFTTVMRFRGVPRSLAECLPAGVVCCRREEWEAIGGYREGMLFAEDVLLILDLKRAGRRRGLRSGYLRDAPAIASARKFDQHGDWHYLTFFTRLVFLALYPPAARRFAHWYWYGKQRST